jgi:hypothetical protein
LRCAEDLLDPHVVKSPLKRSGEDRIAIAWETLWRAVPWTAFNDLLGCPLSRRILGDVEVQNFPARMGTHNQHEEKLESDRRAMKKSIDARDEIPYLRIVTIDDPTLPSRQHEFNNIKDHGFSGRTGERQAREFSSLWFHIVRAKSRTEVAQPRLTSRAALTRGSA